MEFTTIIPGASIILLGFGFPAILQARRNLKTIKQPAITVIGILFMLIMPLMGWVCYHAVDDVTHGLLYKPVIDWRYFMCLIAVTIIISIYFISRSKKQQISHPIRMLMMVLMILGIVLATGIMIEFYWIGLFGAAFLLSPGFIFSALAFPYYSLLSVIILLSSEIFALGKSIKIDRTVI